MLQGLESLPVRQQPEWPDPSAANQVLDIIQDRDPLVSPKETDDLLSQMGMVANADAFLLQAGSCAESFSDKRQQVQSYLKAVLPMNMILSYSVGLPIVKVGRIAGQYAKPRSSPQEEVNGIWIPSFRGEIVNSPEPTLEARTPDPKRLLEAYDHSLRTIHSLRELTQEGGFADIDRMLEWNVEFNKERDIQSYTDLISGIDRAIKLMRSSGVTDKDMQGIHVARVYTSHEALIMKYEEALTRQTPKGLYDGSAHMLWIGERTREVGEQHVEFCAQVENPIGVKIGPTTTREEILALCEKLNPNRIPGKLTFIVRMGAEKIRDLLPNVIEAVQEEEQVVAWVVDPMHGNTETDMSGLKTRYFDKIKDDIDGFFDTHEATGTWPGGLHLEMTGDNVTECIGGSGPGEVSDLTARYETNCDPRLSGAQGIELAFEIAPRLEQIRQLRQKDELPKEKYGNIN